MTDIIKNITDKNLRNKGIYKMDLIDDGLDEPRLLVINIDGEEFHVDGEGNIKKYINDLLGNE
jgi:hypothetical protein